MLDEKAVTSEPRSVELPQITEPISPAKISPPTPPMRQPVSPEQLLRLGIMLGVAMIGLGAFISFLQGDNLLEAWFGNHLPLGDMGLGLLIGLGVGVSLWIVGKYVQGFYHIRLKLIETLDFKALQWWHIVVLSLWAAFPEEILFRGAIQPVLGIMLTAIIFGALHSVTRLYFIYATLAGLGLGLLVSWRGDLWMAIAAHFAVDFVGLGFLKWWVTQLPVEDDPPLIDLG